MHPRLEPLPPDDGPGGIGAGGENVRATTDLARQIKGFALDAMALRDLGGKPFAVRASRTEHLDPLDLPHFQQGFHIRRCHAARAEHPERATILPRHDIGPDGAVCSDAQVLQVAVVDDGERRTGLDIREKHQAAIAAWARAVLLLRANAFILALVDDVGFHPDGEVAAGGAPFHRSPLVELPGVARRDADVDARAADGLARCEVAVGRLEGPPHRSRLEHAPHDLVVDQQGHRPPFRMISS